MTQSGSPGDSQPQPGRAQPPAASAQHLMPGAQLYSAGAWPVPASARPPAAEAGRTGRLRRLAWASVPVWSIGFLAFAPFLRLAVARRSGKDWAVFAGYLAAVVLEIVALSVTHTNSAWGTATGGLIILLMGGGAVHSFVTFRHDPARAAVSGPATSEQLNREALASARSRMERRREAREIAGQNPVLCRELRIGRPDLAREYDDGGLVDVNQVPGEILQSQLGLSADEAAAVLAARTKLGSFTSVDEVSTYAQLAPDRLDAISDWMIFS
jgi:DNA uptake protein ComE-like DNA-binding protein